MWIFSISILEIQFCGILFRKRVTVNGINFKLASPQELSPSWSLSYSTTRYTWRWKSWSSDYIQIQGWLSNYQHLYNLPLYLHNWQKVIQVLSEKQSSVLSLSTLWVLFRIKNFLLFQCLLVMYTCNLWTWSVLEKVKLHWVWKWRNTQTLWDFISELCSYSCLGLCWWNGFWENIWELDKYFTKFMVDETYFTDRMSSGHGGKRVYSIYLNLNLVLYTPLRGSWF